MARVKSDDPVVNNPWAQQVYSVRCALRRNQLLSLFFSKRFFLFLKHKNKTAWRQKALFLIAINFLISINSHCHLNLLISSITENSHYDRYESFIVSSGFPSLSPSHSIKALEQILISSRKSEQFLLKFWQIYFTNDARKNPIEIECYNTCFETDAIIERRVSSLQDLELYTTKKDVLH